MKFRLVYVNDRNPSVLKTSLVKFEMKYNALVLSEIISKLKASSRILHTLFRFSDLSMCETHKSDNPCIWYLMAACSNPILLAFVILVMFV